MRKKIDTRRSGPRCPHQLFAMALLVRLVVVALVCFPLVAGQTLQWYQWYQGLCPIGQVPYIDPLQNRPSLCSTVSQVCPLGYTCSRGSGTNQASSLLVCCAPAGTCSSGGTIYRDVTGAIPSCAPNVAGNCPPSYTCSPATTRLGQYLCCGGGSIGGTQYICPQGGVSSITCQLGSPFSTCQLGQTCQSATNSPGIGICCTGGTIGGTCPNGLPSTGICSQLQPTCTLGSTCTQTLSGFACCSATTGATCPSGGAPAPATCLSIGTQCQVGYTCQQTLTGVACCPSGSIGGTCPTGGQALPATCLAAGTACASGYTCQQSLTGLACCPGGSVGGTCPNGGQALPATCLGVGTACANGYTCQQTLTGIACCQSSIIGGTAQCPTGYTPAISAVDGTPRTCTGLIDLTCPVGYSCLQSTTAGAYLCCQLGTGTIGKKR